MAIKFSKRFIIGYFRAFDIFASNKNWPDISDPKQRDYKALEGDWINVGKSIKKASRDYAEKHRVGSL